MINSCQVEEIPLFMTENHLTFNIGSGGFSPFVLIWEEKGEKPEETPGDDTPQSSQQEPTPQDAEAAPEEESTAPFGAALFPQTGDPAQFGLWVVLALASLLALAVLARRRKKHSTEE